MVVVMQLVQGSDGGGDLAGVRRWCLWYKTEPQGLIFG